MKKGTIFGNTVAEYETYFIFQNTVKSGKSEMPKVGGYELYKMDGKWNLRKCQSYTHCLKDETQHPIIGVVDIDDILKNYLVNKINELKMD